MSDSHPRPPRPEALEGLIRRATAADGSPPFSDGALIDASRELVWLGPAAALVSGTEAEFVVDPDARREGHGTALLSLLLRRGDLLFWAHGDHPGARALARSHGLAPLRTLLHLEAEIGPALPKRLAGSIRPWTASSTTQFLDLNSRAFAHHPEQGGLDRAGLDALNAEPWFDPDDFLLLWDDPTLIGYCWLKVEGGEGEFYVVGVSPDRQGEGLGRLLMDAGLARLSEKGIRMAHLYVEGDNAPALALYESFGFTRRSVDIQYGRPRVE